MKQLSSFTQDHPSRDTMDSDDDVLLIKRIHNSKDLKAFEVLYDRYYRRLLRFIYRLTRRLELVEEIHNDTMFVVWQSAYKFDMRSRVSTWIHGIAYLKSLKALKHAGAKPIELLPEMPEPIDPGQPDSICSTNQVRNRVNEALQTLSPEHRAVLELTYYHGYSYQEIAKIVECPINTVKTRMFYAREKLRRLLPSLND